MNSIDLEFTLRWGSAIIIATSIIGLLFIYRKQVHDFIMNNISRMKTGAMEYNLDKQGLEKLRDMSQVSGFDRVTDSKQQYREGADLSAREIILNKWSSLIQMVHDIAIDKGFRLTPDSNTPDVLERLLKAEFISPDLADAINFLFEEGKIVSDNPGRIDREYAIIYEEIAGRLVDWVLVNIISKRQAEKEDQKKSPDRRQTVVGVTDENLYFAWNLPKTPLAWLVGKGGKFDGKRFSIDKEQYKIGRNSSNDLCLIDDDYVSGNHASINYMEDNLFLYDLNSRNGTFINDRKITGVSCALRKGDHLRFGNSVFEVA